jgi:DNA-binding Lrp family transcriptional regulator
MAGRPPAASDLEILSAVSAALDGSGDPVATTREVTERLPIKREAVSRRLSDLAERRLLARKKIGVSYAWWLPGRVAEVLAVASGGESHDDGTSSGRALDAHLQEVFDVGREQFGLDIGVVARVDPDADRFEVEYADDTTGLLAPGTELPLSETYCTEPLSRAGPASVSDPQEQGLDDRTVHDELGLCTYLGTVVDPDGRDSRTFFFTSENEHPEPFSDRDRELHGLLGAHLKREFDGRAAPG